MDEAAGLVTDTADTAATAAADTAATADTKAPQEPEVAAPTQAAPKPEPDPLTFPMLLRTQRLMEQDARSVMLSSLRIV